MSEDVEKMHGQDTGRRTWRAEDDEDKDEDMG